MSIYYALGDEDGVLLPFNVNDKFPTFEAAARAVALMAGLGTDALATYSIVHVQTRLCGFVTIKHTDKPNDETTAT